MATHHPDRGGEAADAARVNETYARMVEWLDERDARAAASPRALARKAKPEMAPASSLKSGFRAGAAKIAGIAVVAMAALVALRGPRKP